MARRALFVKIGESPPVVYEVVRVLDPSNNRLLLSGSSPTWTVTEVSNAVFTADYQPYSPPITAGDRWADDQGFTVEVDARFNISGNSYVVFHPIDEPFPRVSEAVAFRTQYTKVV